MKNLNGDAISDDAALNEAVKRIYLLETGHYSSNIFKKTNGAGTIAFAEKFPYGWSMLADFWTKNPDFAPTGKYLSVNGFQYLIFPSVLAGQKAVAEILKKRAAQGLNAGAYNSLNEAEAAEYLQRLLSISIPENEKIRPNIYLSV